MKKVFLFLVLAICPIFFYGQHRVQISYDIPEPEIVSWNSDSIAPFKIVDGYLQRVDVLQCPGKSKDEIYNGVFSYIANWIGTLNDFVQDKDRSAGKITVSWKHNGNAKNGWLKYICSRVMTIEAKDGKMRVISNLHTLDVGVTTNPYTGAKTSNLSGAIAELYPIAHSKRKKPNYYEKLIPQILRLEFADVELLKSGILESVSRENDDW